MGAGIASTLLDSAVKIVCPQVNPSFSDILVYMPVVADEKHEAATDPLPWIPSRQPAKCELDQTSVRKTKRRERSVNSLLKKSKFI